MNKKQAENYASRQSKDNRGVVYIVTETMMDYTVYAESDYGYDEELIICKFENGHIVQ